MDNHNTPKPPGGRESNRGADQGAHRLPITPPKAPGNRAPTAAYDKPTAPSGILTPPLRRTATSFPKTRPQSQPPPPTQKPHTSQYLAKLLRIVRRSCASDKSRLRALSRAAAPASMADFLASFNFGAGTTAPVDDSACTSIDEIHGKLRAILDTKVTPTRAEHVSLTLKLRSSAKLNIPVSDTENDAVEELAQIDPVLGGVQSLANHGTPQPTRVISVHDALLNQSNDAALQRTIAKHILEALSTADISQWTVRDLSRGPQGWSFTYICKGGHQHWSRQNHKNPTMAIIGDFSFRDPDPVLNGRPAFDCRGSILIAFDRSNRAISIKYEHTPLHRTVAELAQQYTPQPRELGPGMQRQIQMKAKPPKTPKKPKAANKEPGTEGKTSQKRSRKPKSEANGDPENGEPASRPKKRAKKKKQEGPVIPPDYPSPTTEEYASQQLQRDVENAALRESGQPIVTEAPEIASASSNTQDSAQPSQIPKSLRPVNVHPEEAARRLTYARKILADAGVNPDSLSSDQMSIFSNQPPELQRDSLALLAKYGADHLQIVPPGNKDKASSVARSQSTTPVQAAQAAPSGPTTNTQLATIPQHVDNARENPTDNNEKALLDAAASAYNTMTSSSKPSKSKRKPGKSRLACSSCKSRKVKCPKEKPMCSECEAHGHTCEYPPPKPKKSKISEPVVTVDDDEPEEVEEEEEDNNDYGEQSRNEPSGSDPETLHSAPTMAAVPVTESQASNMRHALPASQTTHYQPTASSTVPHAEVDHSNTHGLLPTGPWGSLRPGVQTHTTPVVAPAVPAPPNPASTRSISPRQSRRSAGVGSSQSQWRLPDSTPSSSSTWTHQTTAHSQPQAPHSNWMYDQRSQNLHTATSSSTTASIGMERTQKTSTEYPSQVPITTSPQLHNNLTQTSNTNNHYWMPHPQASTRSSLAMPTTMHTQSHSSPYQGAGDRQQRNTRQNQQAQTWTNNTHVPDSFVTGNGRSTDAYHHGYHGNTNRYMH